MTTDERQELQAHVDAGFGRLEVRLDAHDARFDAHDTRFDAHDARFDAHDARFDKLEAHIERTTSSLLGIIEEHRDCLLYTSPSPRDGLLSRMPSSA